MKSLNRKLALSALAIAMLATPALAKEHQTAATRQHRAPPPRSKLKHRTIPMAA
jgi:hypothetical protein